MGRAKVILQSEFPYNITARCINRDWFSLPMDTVWNIFSEELYMTSRLYDWNVHSFVLMNNHFHLMVSTPNANVSKCLHRFMTNSSSRLTSAGNRINETFAGRNFKTVLHKAHYFLNAYKYNYRNPVEAGAVIRVEEYKYSTLHGLLGQSPLLIPLVSDDTLFASVESTLEWLNTKPDPEKTEAVRYGLKRAYFKSKKCGTNNWEILGQDDIL